MATNKVNLELPASVYDQLQELAAVEQKDPIEVITELIDMAHQRQSWLRELEENVPADEFPFADPHGRMVKILRVPYPIETGD